MAEAGLQEVETYVTRHHNTSAQLIVISPIMDLFLAREHSPGSSVTKQWWEKYGLDM